MLRKNKFKLKIFFETVVFLIFLTLVFRADDVWGVQCYYCEWNCFTSCSSNFNACMPGQCAANQIGGSKICGLVPKPDGCTGGSSCDPVSYNVCCCLPRPGTTSTPTPTPRPGTTPTPTSNPPQQYDQYGRFIAWFYEDKNNDGDYTSGVDGNLPSEVLNNIVTTVTIPNERVENFTGISTDLSDYLVIATKPCRSECCCPFGPSCGGGRDCEENVQQNFAFNMSYFRRGFVNIGKNTVCKRADFSFSVPQNWEITRIKYNTPYHNTQCPGYGSWQSSSQILTSNQGANSISSFLENQNYDWELTTRLIKVGIRKKNKPPSIFSISANPSSCCSVGNDNSTTIYTYYQDEDGGDRLIENGSFEESVNYWHFGPINRVISNFNPKFGSSVLEVNQPCPGCPSELGGDDYSFYQDVPLTTTPNERYSWSIYVRSPWGSPISGNLVLWNKESNGFHKVFDVYFSTSSTSWQQIKGSGLIGQAGDTLRAQVYLGTGGNAQYHFDGARLVKDEDSGLWTDIQKAYIGLTNCSNDPGEAGCRNFERNLSNYFGASYNPKSDKVWVAQQNAVSSCSGGAASCPWGTGVYPSQITPNTPIANQNGTVMLTGVRPSVEEGTGRLKIEWDLSFNNLAAGTYNLYGMVNDGKNIYQTGTELAQWDQKGNPIVVRECLTEPWFQTQEGDVHAGGSIRSKIPSNATSPYFSLKGQGGYHGLVSYYGNDPSFGSGWVSEDPKWQAKSQAKRSDYELFFKLLEPTLEYPRNSNGEVSNNDLPSGDGVKAYNGDIQTKDSWSIGTKKIVLLTSGKFLIKNPISIAEGGSLVVVAKEGIGVSKNFGGTTNYLEGIFITDGTFYSSVDEDFSFTSKTSSKALVIRGGVIAKDFNLSRNLEVNNFTTPAEKFIYRPNLVINSYPGIWKGSHIWEELAP